MWDFIIKAKRASSMLPVLETVLAAFGHDKSQTKDNETISIEHATQVVRVRE
jgi:hypothetical protein